MADAQYIFPTDSAGPATAPHHFDLGPDTTLLRHHTYALPGEQGTPQPYTIRTDNVLTIALMLVFMLGVIALARSGHRIARQLKRFAYPQLSSDDDGAYSHYGFHIFMTATDSFMIAIGAYIVATEWLGAHFAVEPQSLVVALFTAETALYFAAKWLLYRLVNGVFFGSRKSRLWDEAYLTITAIEGALLFPLSLLLVYFDLGVEKALVCFIIILFLNKILTFYKAWSIFFRQNDFSLQIFLYFCTLEIVPLLAFSGLWLMNVEFLKVII